ncbi:hypothetical protein BU23DRAFT_575482 [Bimuria novae-zelandiae CBS 107.79]|uniref:Uncharacterized protein n=1 Tax=Bimuria novae-zelandiae CBS 107.79 TaxID=1447943 RepID=A0A6A5UHQ2_9PLEO|nr:hypothetical protein BU23DRAFT_575482 [Bimuria novae-zelandiae CBS 107.79]
MPGRHALYPSTWAEQGVHVVWAPYLMLQDATPRVREHRCVRTTPCHKTGERTEYDSTYIRSSCAAEGVRMRGQQGPIVKVSSSTIDHRMYAPNPRDTVVVLASRNRAFMRTSVYLSDIKWPAFEGRVLCEVPYLHLGPINGFSNWIFQQPEGASMETKARECEEGDGKTSQISNGPHATGENSSGLAAAASGDGDEYERGLRVTTPATRSCSDSGSSELPGGQLKCQLPSPSNKTRRRARAAAQLQWQRDTMPATCPTPVAPYSRDATETFNSGTDIHKLMGAGRSDVDTEIHKLMIALKNLHQRRVASELEPIRKSVCPDYEPFDAASSAAIDNTIVVARNEHNIRGIACSRSHSIGRVDIDNRAFSRGRPSAELLQKIRSTKSTEAVAVSGGYGVWAAYYTCERSYRLAHCEEKRYASQLSTLKKLFPFRNLNLPHGRLPNDAAQVESILLP